MNFSNIISKNRASIIGKVGAGANMLFGGVLNKLVKLGTQDPIWYISVHRANKPFLEGSCGIEQIDCHEGVEVPNAPMENGSFTSYNIVERPKEIKVRLIDANEKEKLARQEQAVRLCMARGVPLDVITPTSTFRNFIITNVDKTSANQNGVNIGVYDITLREIQNIILSRMSEAKQVNNVTMTITKKKGFLPELTSKATESYNSVLKSCKDGINGFKENISTLKNVSGDAYSTIKGMI